MAPWSTIHFSAPLFFQPVKFFPLKRETHPLCGCACATITAPNNTAAARMASIFFTVKPPSPLARESEDLVERNLSQIQRSSSLFVLSPGSLARWFDSQPPVGLACFHVTDAQLRQVDRIALINLLQRKVRVIYFVLPRRHVFRIIRRGSDDRASLPNPHAKFLRGRLIVRVAEAMADASALDRMPNK